MRQWKEYMVRQYFNYAPARVDLLNLFFFSKKNKEICEKMEKICRTS